MSSKKDDQTVRRVKTGDVDGDFMWEQRTLLGRSGLRKNGVPKPGKCTMIVKQILNSGSFATSCKHL